MKKQQAKILVAVAKEQGEWQTKNFGDGDYAWPLVGVIEELGELSHRLLKHHQGIRKFANISREEADKALAVGVIDDISDAAIFLMGGYNRTGRPFSSIFAHEFHVKPKAYRHKDLLEVLAMATGHAAAVLELRYREADGQEEFIERLMDKHAFLLLTLLDEIAVRHNSNLADAVAHTWSQVVGRDWSNGTLASEVERAVNELDNKQSDSPSEDIVGSEVSDA